MLPEDMTVSRKRSD